MGESEAVNYSTCQVLKSVEWVNRERAASEQLYFILTTFANYPRVIYMCHLVPEDTKVHRHSGLQLCSIVLDTPMLLQSRTLLSLTKAPLQALGTTTYPR